MTHEITTRRTPISVIVLCSCGWSENITRKQNARARAAKVEAAFNRHSKDVEARRAEKVASE